MIRVQREDFDVGRELARFGAGNARIGGICVFVGLVREMTEGAGGEGRNHQSPGADKIAAGSDSSGARAPGGEGRNQPVAAMTLEHYPGMTEAEIARIVADARARWPLDDVLVIHRYGRLEPGDRIVLVATASAHREAAFDSCHFLIDWLKTKAPFWKREETPRGGQWVAARESDDSAAARWGQPPKTGS